MVILFPLSFLLFFHYPRILRFPFGNLVLTTSASRFLQFFVWARLGWVMIQKNTERGLTWESTMGFVVYVVFRFKDTTFAFEAIQTVYDKMRWI